MENLTFTDSPVAITTTAAPRDEDSQREIKPRLLPAKTSFEVSKLLGKGAQASVYLAEESKSSSPSSAADTDSIQQQLPDQFALKLFNQWADTSSIEHEAATHQKLAGSQHIVQLLGMCEMSATVHIPRCLPEHANDKLAKWRRGHTAKERQTVMALELCKHGDFFSYVEKYGAVTDQKMLKFLFLQVCQGVHALHTVAGVAHMDIKLDNILVSEDGTLKMCDFGMVQPVDANIAKNFGTEMYMAPEIKARQYYETYRGTPTDIFSLGVLLWILHFGRPPFHKAEMSDRHYALLQKNPQSFWRMHPTVKSYEGEVDEDLKSLLVSMLSLGPQNRPQSVVALANHSFFTKEEDLVDALENKWVEQAALQTQFREQLAAMNTPNED